MDTRDVFLVSLSMASVRLFSSLLPKKVMVSVKEEMLMKYSGVC